MFLKETGRKCNLYVESIFSRFCTCSITMCCIISGEPVEDVKGRIKTYPADGRQMFQTDMVMHTGTLFHVLFFNLNGF